MSAPADATRVGPTSRLHLLRLGLPAAVVAVDQITKSLAVDRLSDGPVDLFWTLRLNLSFNSGLAFSQGTGMTGLITIVAVALVAGLVWWSFRLTRPVAVVAAALLLGGAAGNLADRLFRAHGGAVIDFVDLQWWPIFNVADVAISAGAILLVVVSLATPAERAS